MSDKKAVITHEIASISLNEVGKVVIEMDLDDFKRDILESFAFVGDVKCNSVSWDLLGGMELVECKIDRFKDMVVICSPKYANPCPNLCIPLCGCLTVKDCYPFRIIPDPKPPGCFHISPKPLKPGDLVKMIDAGIFTKDDFTEEQLKVIDSIRNRK